MLNVCFYKAPLRMTTANGVFLLRNGCLKSQPAPALKVET